MAKNYCSECGAKLSHAAEISHGIRIHDITGKKRISQFFKNYSKYIKDFQVNISYTFDLSDDIPEYILNDIYENKRIQRQIDSWEDNNG